MFESDVIPDGDKTKLHPYPGRNRPVLKGTFLIIFIMYINWITDGRSNNCLLDRDNCTCYHKSQIIYHAKKRRVDAERCRRELRQVKRSALECVEYGLGACSAE